MDERFYRAYAAPARAGVGREIWQRRKDGEQFPAWGCALRRT